MAERSRRRREEGRKVEGGEGKRRVEVFGVTFYIVFIVGLQTEGRVEDCNHKGINKLLLIYIIQICLSCCNKFVDI